MIIRSVNGKPMALPPYGGFLTPPLGTGRHIIASGADVHAKVALEC
jgi:hypothetical protein